MKRTKKEAIEDKAINAVAEYLRSIDWNPLIGSFTGIEQDFGKYKYRLVFSFLGKKKNQILIKEKNEK